MQDKRLITREPLPGDKRQARLRLTPEGLAVYEAIFPQVKQLNQALLRGLPTEAVDLLDQALILLQANADALRAENAHLPRTYRMRGGRRRGG